MYGRWIGGEVSSWSRMCCIEEPTYVAEQLTWEHQADRPGWQVETYDLTDDHQRMLRRLGWVRKDADSFALPALGSVGEGRIVARTSVEVLGANLDEDIPLKFNLADWRGARERLLEYLESGWPDSEG